MNLKKVLAVGLVSISLAAGVLGYGKYQDRKTEQVQQKLRNTALSYLSQPEFSNPDFMKQITGTDAELEKYNLDQGMLYLSMPINTYTEESLSRLSENPSAIEFGKTNSGDFVGNRIELDEYALTKPGHYFFRFPAKDFKVDPSDSIIIKHKTADYSVTIKELQGFLHNSSIYGGYLYAYTDVDDYGTYSSIPNHGTFVSKKGEPSLERLVNSLAGKENSKERKAQKLLDFVTKEIEYNFQEAFSGVETLKKPNEVLMTENSDCSGKVILYASLLEQTDIDYRLVYTNNSHITVAVEGNYTNKNDLSFNLGDDTYHIAETTAEGFQIGKTIVQDLGIENIEYIQRPGPDSKIYHARTGNALQTVEP